MNQKNLKNTSRYGLKIALLILCIAGVLVFYTNESGVPPVEQARQNGTLPGEKLLAAKQLSYEKRSNTSPKSTFLLDVDTGRELASLEPDRVIIPASLTKLVTAYVTLEAVANGECSLTERFVVPKAAWAKNMPPDYSLMFLGPDQQVNLHELLLGLIVASGNDAAIAIAIRVSGSVDAFVERMNDTVQKMGFKTLHFADPAGLSVKNRMTAREYAYFLSEYIKRFPDALYTYHAVQSMLYPGEENLPPGTTPPQGTILFNRNNLLTRYWGCDGLKTGHLQASGYHLAATSSRGGKRLVVLVLGIDAVTSAEGSKRREAEAIRLLNYGFAQY